MTAVLAGAASTPIAAAVMTLEVFGPALAPYAALAGLIRSLMTGGSRAYPSRVLAMATSPPIRAEIGLEVERVAAELEPADTRPVRFRRFLRLLLRRSRRG